MTTTPKRKRQQISIEKKKQIIDASATKSYGQLATDFGLSSSSIAKIVQNKTKILTAIEEGAGAKRKRLRSAKDTDLEAAVLTWFQQVRSQNVAVTGPLLKVNLNWLLILRFVKEKALELAEMLEIEGFKASDHWLENFKNRHEIKFRTEQGEAAAVDQEVVTTWQETVLREALAKYSADDVFNADETGLFWRLMPNKTLAFKGNFYKEFNAYFCILGEKCSGGKKSKERVTVLIGSNASGTDKLPLFMIGKSAKPRAFKNAKLPFKYAANKKAWMTGKF